MEFALWRGSLHFIGGFFLFSLSIKPINGEIPTCMKFICIGEMITIISQRPIGPVNAHLISDPVNVHLISGPRISK